MTLSFQNALQNRRLHIRRNSGNKHRKPSHEEPQLEVRFFSKQVVVAVAVYPEAKVIRNFPHNVHLIAVDGKGTKNPEDFFLFNSRKRLIGFIFKLSADLFLGLYLDERKKATAEDCPDQLSLILLNFASLQPTNKKAKTESLDHRSFGNLSALLNLAAESFGVELKRHDLGMYFPLIKELRSKVTELALSLVSTEKKLKSARAVIPLKGREIGNNARLESLVKLANLLQISLNLLKQLSQSSQGNGVESPHSSAERGKSNTCRKGQPKKDKGKYPAKSRVGETRAERNRKDLIKDIKGLSNKLVKQLKQLKAETKSIKVAP